MSPSVTGKFVALAVLILATVIRVFSETDPPVFVTLTVITILFVALSRDGVPGTMPTRAGSDPGSKSQLTVASITAGLPPKAADTGCSGAFIVVVYFPRSENPVSGRLRIWELNTGDHVPGPVPPSSPGAHEKLTSLFAPGNV
jgi:hypothetical protein